MGVRPWVRHRLAGDHMTAIFFYLFATLCIASAAAVIVAKNPVHAVLFLILAFFNAAGLFVLLGAEFLAMLLVIVYVGAVAVLFLFVVMMLDVDFAELRAGFIKNAPLGALIGGLKIARVAGGDFRIARPAEQVRYILQVSTLDRVLTPYPTVEDALLGYDGIAAQAGSGA